jgi:hypothetical protein
VPGTDDEFPFAGHSRAFIETYAQVMRECAMEAADSAVKAEFLAAALAAEAHLLKLDTPD